MTLVFYCLVGCSFVVLGLLAWFALWLFNSVVFDHSFLRSFDMYEIRLFV